MATQIYVSGMGKMQVLSLTQGTFHYRREPVICSSLIQEPILKGYYSLQAWQLPGTRIIYFVMLMPVHNEHQLQHFFLPFHLQPNLLFLVSQLACFMFELVFSTYVLLPLIFTTLT
jgi:hypothetical protein